MHGNRAPTLFLTSSPNTSSVRAPWMAGGLPRPSAFKSPKPNGHSKPSAAPAIRINGHRHIREFCPRHALEPATAGETVMRGDDSDCPAMLTHLYVRRSFGIEISPFNSSARSQWKPHRRWTATFQSESSRARALEHDLAKIVVSPILAENGPP